MSMKHTTSLLLIACLGACTDRVASTKKAEPPKQGGNPHGLCENFATPRIETVAPGVHVAIGYDLANTVLIETNAGHVVVDAGLSPAAAKVTKAALLAKAPGKVRTLIYTHSHLDHVGGASAWIEPDTEIWASHTFVHQFFKQYGLFQPIEQVRAGRQYGTQVSRDLLPCTAIGPLPDLQKALESGARMPTRTFDHETTLNIGGVQLRLFEANGETQDQILIWLPEPKIAIAGDNIYKAFPNLYTIRGTSPRPVDEWIDSLDLVRRLGPEVLIPGHTAPLSGGAAIAKTVTTYRDAIQWVRDGTVRAANEGAAPSQIAERLKLPPHLANDPFLTETYGQVDWSIRALYDNTLGWFSGEANQLYPMDQTVAATREVALMGGAMTVLSNAEKALAANDPKWAIHLLVKLRDLDDATGTIRGKTKDLLAQAYDAMASHTLNTNGRAYLAEMASEIRNGGPKLVLPRPDDDMLRQVPLRTFFRRLATRLKADAAFDVFESVRFEFSDVNAVYTVTVRRGVAEVVEGEPLPDTPQPIGTIRADSLAWKKLGLQELSIASALAAGSVKVEGDWLNIARFLSRFELE